MDVVTTPSPGTRPRVTGEREQEILRAAFDVLREVGYDKLTLDTVAARARASKATLYRRWTTKAALVVEMMTCLEGTPDVPDTGALRGDLVALAEQKRDGVFGADSADVIFGLATAMHRDGELREAFLTQFLGPKQDCFRTILERARGRGEVAPGVDLELVGQIIPAVMLFRMSLGRTIEPPDRLAVRIIDEVVLPAVRGPAG
jgi:AcrR family transcriptional regulator